MPQIDTEGFDATVIQGAMEAITHGSVGVLSFEYHKVGVGVGDWEPAWQTLLP